VKALKLTHLLLSLVVMLVSCQPPAAPTNIIVTEHPASVGRPIPSVTLTESSVHFRTREIDLTITKPPKWETFSTEFGVVIAEKFGSVANGGILEGLMSYTFVTPLTDFVLPTSTHHNLTQTIFDQIIADPNYVYGAAISPTYGFDWNGYDAAYYLLNDGEGTVTMVLGVALTGKSVLLTTSISAPVDYSYRIRESLPQLLDGLQINGTAFRGNILDQFPDPLQFPVFEVETN
jgi:hypothetical protein